MFLALHHKIHADGESPSNILVQFGWTLNHKQTIDAFTSADKMNRKSQTLVSEMIPMIAHFLLARSIYIHYPWVHFQDLRHLVRKVITAEPALDDPPIHPNSDIIHSNLITRVMGAAGPCLRCNAIRFLSADHGTDFLYLFDLSFWSRLLSKKLRWIHYQAKSQGDRLQRKVGTFHYFQHSCCHVSLRRFFMIISGLLTCVHEVLVK